MAGRGSIAGLDRKRLRLWLTLFFLALAIPTAVLVQQAYSELKWEAFHRYRTQAEELAARIDRRYLELMKREEARPFTDFSFLNVLGDTSTGFLQRSALAAYPLNSDIPGLIGYFQIDADGRFSSPLLPERQTDALEYGVPEPEYRQRLDHSLRIRQILSSNLLVSIQRAGDAEPRFADADDAGAGRDRSDHVRSLPSAGFSSAAGDTEYKLASPPAREEIQAQAAFDLLEKSTAERRKQKAQQRSGVLGRVEDLKLDKRFQPEADEVASPKESELQPLITEKRVRRERNVLPAPVQQKSAGESEQHLSGIPVKTFESELDPYQLNLLESGEFVMYRKVWRDGQRYIQGMLIAREPFLQDVIRNMFHEGSLSAMSDLLVAFRGDVLSVFGATSGERGYLPGNREFQGSLLLQQALSAPLDGLDLIFSVTRLPSGAGRSVVLWTSGVLLFVLCGGFLLMYRLGLGQIELARQQQDFVSAVSHELKTPLTSIRMYGEMLMEGWVNEQKRKEYYRYIASEGERLSRLIENVLQLARMNRNELQINLEPRSVKELMAEIGPRIISQAEHAGFDLQLECREEVVDMHLLVDRDCLTQVVINLVDNAIKFSSKAVLKRIEVQCRLDPEGRMLLSVRDHGPGVARDQAKKIFRMFYRSESELTRETVGTGIGLALVHQLVLAMNARVDVVNRDPGAEFLISFPLYQADGLSL